MNNFTCDLLVHITAPSRVKDDKRYTGIAQSIINFQPLTTTKVTGLDHPTQSSNATDILDNVDPQDPWPNSDDVSLTWIQAHDDVLDDAQLNRDQLAEQQPFRIASGRPLPQQAGHCPLSRVKHPSGRPATPRPRTAPENLSPSSKVDIPFTGTSRRRAYSEVSSFSDSFLTVPNSHDTPRNPDLHVELDDIALSADKFHVRERSPSVRSGPKLKRRRLDKDMIADGGRTPLELVQRTGSPFGFIPTTPNHSNTGERNLSEPETESKSVSSTLSPSQPLKLGAVGNCTRLSPHIPSVDLTTPPREQHIHQNEKVLETYLSQQKSTVDNRLCGDNTGHRNRPSFVGRTKELADEINGPEPVGGEQRFTTHITKPYELLSEQISMAKVFRPTQVARDVLALERGYWLFTIRTGTDGIVTDSRKKLSPEERRSKLRCDLGATTCLERVRKFDSQHAAHQEESGGTTLSSPFWTQAEFTTFWENMSQFIRDGKAGWGSRLVKEAHGDNTWDVRFFCWGEVLGHAWLALWIISDKLVGRTPMTWMSADGLAVVRMSGKKQSRAQLGPWVRKAEGESGYWGISEK